MITDSESDNFYFLALQGITTPREGFYLQTALREERLSLKELSQFPPSILQAKGFSREFIAALKKPEQDRIHTHLDWLSQSEMRYYITLTDPLYPALLRALPDPPMGFFLEGQPLLLNQFQIALVGARQATPLGLELAQSFARQLNAAGIIVTSGLAEGIDGAAHRGTLPAREATIAVVGTGLDSIYPRHHRGLAKQILEQGGAILSEYPLTTPPQPMNFPRRNRLIAGLSLGVCVVEAALKSGSLITANLALKYDREVFAVPGSPLNRFAEGCNRLIQNGARLVTTVSEMLAELPFLMQSSIASSPMPRHNSHEFDDPDPKISLVLKAVGYEPTLVDKIASRSGLAIPEVTAILSALELAGRIRASQHGFIQIQ